jgi:hypothetical protein
LALTKVTSGIIEDGTIVNADLSSSIAVTGGQLADDAVTTAKILDNNVTIGKISGSAAGAAGTFLKQDGTWATAGTVTDTTGIESDIALLGFKVAVNGSLAKYNLVDQTEDAFMDATGIDAVASTGATRKASNYYSGGDPSPTGGTITTYVDSGTTYKVHSFTSDGTFTGAGISTDYLQVAGGGGGGAAGNGAGGGAGGMLTGTATLSTVTVDVGLGGGPSLNGENSSITGLTASVGGGAGGWAYGGYGQVGGSGGGGPNDGANRAGGAGTAGQGNAGPASGGGGSPWPASGGGGKGSAGTAGTSGGTGGAGEASSITGASVTYAGGGGGASSAGGAAGGTGGGGAGGSGGGTDGTDGLGGGGGGANSGTAASGGDGIVILRYDSALAPGMVNMVLQSNATTAETAPTKGDIVMTYTNAAGTTTINTDLTAEFSADGGTTWTSTTLVAKGTTGSASPHFIVSAHDVAITSTITAPYNMKYRIKTLNQSDAKATNIQAVSLGWS